jgi:hypothetical protein
MLLVVAVLMGLTALAATLAPRDSTPRGSGTPSAPSPARTPTAPVEEATPAPAPSGAPDQVETVSAELSADEGAKRRRVSADVGDLVDITVEGDVIDAVSVEGLSDHATLDPDSPARLELFADAAGQYPITLLEADRRIGTLDVKEP